MFLRLAPGMIKVGPSNGPHKVEVMASAQVLGRRKRESFSCGCGHSTARWRGAAARPAVPGSKTYSATWRRNGKSKSCRS